MRIKCNKVDNLSHFKIDKLILFKQDDKEKRKKIFLIINCRITCGMYRIS